MVRPILLEPKRVLGQLVPPATMQEFPASVSQTLSKIAAVEAVDAVDHGLLLGFRLLWDLDHLAMDDPGHGLGLAAQDGHCCKREFGTEVLGSGSG